jgi:hypothetical protein
MTVDTVLALLASQSAARLEAMEHALDEQIVDLASQKTLIDRALVEKGARTKATPSGSDEDTKPSKRRRTRGRRTGSSTILRDIFNETPNVVFQPAEVISEAHARGVASSAQAIRVQLRRLGEQGFLARGPEGRGWMLAMHPTDPEPLHDPPGQS